MRELLNRVSRFRARESTIHLCALSAVVNRGHEMAQRHFREKKIVEGMGQDDRIELGSLRGPGFQARHFVKLTGTEEAVRIGPKSHVQTSCGFLCSTSEYFGGLSIPEPPGSSSFLHKRPVESEVTPLPGFIRNRG
jgi:hypothetical protein